MRDGGHRIVRGTPCGRPAKEGISDECWRPAGGGVFQVDGALRPCKLGGRSRSRERAMRRERVKDEGVIGVRSGGGKEGEWRSRTRLKQAGWE